MQTFELEKIDKIGEELEAKLNKGIVTKEMADKLVPFQRALSEWGENDELKIEKNGKDCFALSRRLNQCRLKVERELEKTEAKHAKKEKKNSDVCSLELPRKKWYCQKLSIATERLATFLMREACL